MAQRNVINLVDDDDEQQDDDENDEELRECLRLSLQEYQQQRESSSSNSIDNNNGSNGNLNLGSNIDLKSNNNSRSSSSSGDILLDDFLVQEGSVALLGVIEGEKARKREIISLSSGIDSPTFTPEEDSLFDKRCVRYVDDNDSDDEALKKALQLSLAEANVPVNIERNELHPSSPDAAEVSEELALREAILLSLGDSDPPPRQKEEPIFIGEEFEETELVVRNQGTYDPMNLIKNDGTSFYLNSISGIDEDGNVGTVSLPQLVPSRGLFNCFLTSYTLTDQDLRWLNLVIPETIPKTIVKGWNPGTDKEGVYVLDRFLTIVHPPFAMADCTFHAKLSLLEYDHDPLFPKGKIRVIVSSANLSKGDWERVGQAVWFQDFPVRSTSSPKTCEFEEQLMRFVKATLPLSFQDTAIFLKKYDFSSANARLVISVPGKFSVFAGRSDDQLAEMQYGHMRLNQILQDFTWPEFIEIEGGPPKPPTPPVVIQASSLGMLQRKWLSEFLRSVAGANCNFSDGNDEVDDKDNAEVPLARNNKKRGRSNKMQEMIDAEFARRKTRKLEEEAAKRPAPKPTNGNKNVSNKEIPDLQIVFPSQNQIEQTLMQNGLGFLWLPENYYTELDTFPRNKFYECCPTDPLRSVILHSKIVTRMLSLPRGVDVGWMYVGSHNFSASAWGSLKLKNTLIEMRNFEVGVVLLRPPPPDINSGRLSSSSSSRSQSATNGEEHESLWAKLPFVFPPEKYSLRDKPFFSTK